MAVLDGTLIVDGMAVVQGFTARMLPITYRDLARKVFNLNMSRGKSYSRIDAVFDRYPDRSIKSLTHQKRTLGQSAGRRVILNSDQNLPKQWKNYLRNGRNKESLIEFFYQEWRTYDVGAKRFIVHHGEECHEFPGDSSVEALRSNQEEADTLMILHAVHASKTSDSITINCDDTDVFVLCLAHSKSITAKFYLLFGRANERTMLDLKRLSSDMGETVTDALIGFHCFTGCDTTSAFHGKGKAKPMQLMLKNARFQCALKSLGSFWEVDDSVYIVLQEFVCQMYGVTGASVDEARYKLFCSKSLGEKKLPPNEDSLALHIARVNYQARIHKLALQNFTQLPDPVHHGWLLDSETNDYNIHWMKLDPAPKEIMHMFKCSCKTGCSKKQCGCRKGGISCSDACSCCDCTNVDTTVMEEELVADDSSSDISDDDE